MTPSGSLAVAPHRRTPSALVLGVLAGVLAAVSVLPTVVPLTRRVGHAEDGAAIVRALAASRATATLYEHDETIHPFLHRSLGADGVMVLDLTGHVQVASGERPDPIVVSELCPPGEAPGRIVSQGRLRWAVACHEVGPRYMLGFVRAQADDRGTGWLVIGLSAMVGISAAFGVLQVLQPLSRLTDALQRLGQGERGVRVEITGLAEYDELVDRLNDAAQASDARQDAASTREAAFRERIEVVQKVARELAHEVRNPLQSLEFMAGVVALEDDPEERRRLASSIQDEVRLLEATVSRLLRDEGIRVMRAPFPLTQLVRHTLDFHGPAARARGVTLEAGTVQDTEILADRLLLERAVENLVVNALQAVGSPGRVVVSVLHDAWTARVVVEDDGPGVPEELGDTIYTPSVSGREGGTGLGLPFVLKVVHAHGGQVRHERSTLGGAAFHIELPLRESPEEVG